MKHRNLFLAFLLLIAITGFVIGISLYFQPEQSTLGIFVIIGAALLGTAAFISGLNDTYDLIGKLSRQNKRPFNKDNDFAKPHTSEGSVRFIDDDSQFLRSIWDRLEPNLQDALSMAYNQSRREGKAKIRTRYLFAAMARLSSEPLSQMLNRLPVEALPNLINKDVTTERTLLTEATELSACVEESLKELVPKSTEEHKISSADVFVDIAKNGTGNSVARLREHNITAERVDQLVSELGWNVTQR